MGFTQGLLATLIADSAPAELRGTGFGMFNLVTGVALLVASVIAGLLWDTFGPQGTFLGGASVAEETLDSMNFVLYLFSHHDRENTPNITQIASPTRPSATDPYCVYSECSMSTLPLCESQFLLSTRASASRSFYHSGGSVRCMGASWFRTPQAQDYGCLLDVDPIVLSWSCLPFAMADDSKLHVADFLVRRSDGDFLIDVVLSTATELPSRWARAADARGYIYEAVPADDLHKQSVRLANAKDLLTYARWRTPLGDRLRLLSVLDEHGSMTVAECLAVFREIPPMAGLASMILHRFLEVDLDDELIHADTTVRLRRD